jgi:hypothetical protein
MSKFSRALLGAAILALVIGGVWFAMVSMHNHAQSAADKKAQDSRFAAISTTTTSVSPVVTVPPQPTVPATTNQPETTAAPSTTIPATEPPTTVPATEAPTTAAPPPPPPPLPPARDSADENGQPLVPVNGAPFAQIRIARFADFWTGRTGHDFETIVRADDTEPDLTTALEGGIAWQGSSNLSRDVNTGTYVPDNDLRMPCETGTAVIAGHRGGKGHGKVFGHIDELQIGDTIDITYNNGASCSYSITTAPITVDQATLVHEMQAPIGDGQGNLLAYTCDPGTSNRIFVRAILVSVDGVPV